jgi:hypothetical protein
MVSREKSLIVQYVTPDGRYQPFFLVPMLWKKSLPLMRSLEIYFASLMIVLVYSFLSVLQTTDFFYLFVLSLFLIYYRLKPIKN